MGFAKNNVEGEEGVVASSGARYVDGCIPHPSTVGKISESVIIVVF